LGIRIIFLSMISAESMRAVLRAFATVGFNSEGYAFIVSYPAGGFLSSPDAEGMISLNRAGGNSEAQNLAQNAHDAMYALLRGVGKVIMGGDGGLDYKANRGDARLEAMNNIRGTSFPASKMAGGALSFDENSNDRVATKDRVFIIKRVSGLLQWSYVGKLSANKRVFETAAGVGHMVWPGNTSVLPADRDLTGIAPRVVSIAWIEKKHKNFDFPQMLIYMQSVRSLMNANKYLLPFTKLELRHEVLNKSTSSKEFTAACERVRREAEAEGKPVVGFISSGTSRTKEVLSMASPLPVVAYTSTQTILADAVLYPWLVRMYPSDSQRAEVTAQMLRNYDWKKVFMIVDNASTWAASLANEITDKSSAHNIEVEQWKTPHLRDMRRLNETQLDLLAAAEYAMAKEYVGRGEREKYS
jgi:ABC-type branched-subunit amino acid transport system substrate-binding protein